MEVQTRTQFRQNEKNNVENRKQSIQTLLKKFSQHKGWRGDFLSQNPSFNNAEGLSMISNGQAGRASNQYFLVALELFDEYIKSQNPSWFRNQS